MAGRAERSGLREDSGNKPVNADRRTESRIHEMRRVVEEIVGGYNVELREGHAKPAGDEVPDMALARGDEGLAYEILRTVRFIWSRSSHCWIMNHLFRSSEISSLGSCPMKNKRLQA